MTLIVLHLLYLDTGKYEIQKIELWFSFFNSMSMVITWKLRVERPARDALMPCDNSRAQQKKDSSSFPVRMQPMKSHGLFMIAVPTSFPSL